MKFQYHEGPNAYWNILLKLRSKVKMQSTSVPQVSIHALAKSNHTNYCLEWDIQTDIYKIVKRDWESGKLQLKFLYPPGKNGQIERFAKIKRKQL